MLEAALYSLLLAHNTFRNTITYSQLVTLGHVLCSSPGSATIFRNTHPLVIQRRMLLEIRGLVKRVGLQPTCRSKEIKLK